VGSLFSALSVAVLSVHFLDRDIFFFFPLYVPGRAEAFNETRKMPAKQPHLLVDPTDGKAYPLDAFLEFYGEDEGQRRWATAGQQPASAGISQFCVSIKVSFFVSARSPPLGLFLSARLSCSLLSPCSPRSHIVFGSFVCGSVASTVVIALPSCLFVCFRVERFMSHSSDGH
jgi:hypothetical protein